MEQFRLMKNINQVCIAVRDAEKKAKELYRDLGAGPWAFLIIEGPPMVEMTVRGEARDFRFKAAICEMEGCYLELIEPMDEVSIFHDFIQKKGEGMHHVGVPVADIDSAVKEAEARGLGVLSSAKWPDGAGGFAYLDTEASFGMVVELLQRPQPENRTKPYGFWPTK